MSPAHNWEAAMLQGQICMHHKLDSMLAVFNLVKWAL